MSNDLPLSPDDVAEIVAILDGSDYTRLDVKTERFRLRVVRAESGDGWTQDWDLSDDTAPAAVLAVKASIAAIPDGLVAIAAPLPGTFYRAPQPGAPPFVEVGAAVGPDTVVGIVETMKLMNPVHAGVSGTITAIVVTNAEGVENGATLMHVTPA
jgi:acetyl-CoA carboxylase biotin carboxyl carrier protein